VVTWNGQYQKLTTSDKYGLIIVWMLYKGRRSVIPHLLIGGFFQLNTFLNIQCFSMKKCTHPRVGLFLDEEQRFKIREY